METASEMYIDGDYVLDIEKGLKNLNNQLPPDNKYVPSQNTGFLMIEINNNMVEEMEHFTEKPDSSLQIINKDYVFVKKSKDDVEKTNKIEQQKTIDAFKKLNIPKVSSTPPVVQDAPVVEPPAEVESVLQDAPTQLHEPPAELVSDVSKEKKETPKKEEPKEKKQAQKKGGTKRKKTKKGGKKTKKRKRSKRKKKRKRTKKKTRKKK